MPTYEFTVPERGSLRSRSFSIWGQKPEDARKIFEDFYRTNIKDGREKEAEITRTEPDRSSYLV